jgi:hypothetical protein
MTPLEYFRLLAPAFAAVPDLTVEQWLTVAEMFVPTGCLDAEKYNMAVALYAAHLLYLSQASAGGGGAVGPVTREKEGDLERSYGKTSGDDTWLGSTPYGQQYLNATLGCYGATIMTRYGTSGNYGCGCG